jgi:hypothetical protein
MRHAFSAVGRVKEIRSHSIFNSHLIYLLKFGQINSFISFSITATAGLLYQSSTDLPLISTGLSGVLTAHNIFRLISI